MTDRYFLACGVCHRDAGVVYAACAREHCGLMGRILNNRIKAAREVKSLQAERQAQIALAAWQDEHGPDIIAELARPIQMPLAAE